jgi:hypothetical protein
VVDPIRNQISQNIGKKQNMNLTIELRWLIKISLPRESDMSMFLSPSPISEKLILGMGLVMLTKVALCSAELRIKHKMYIKKYIYKIKTMSLIKAISVNWDPQEGYFKS